jgi:hypothetical protein
MIIDKGKQWEENYLVLKEWNDHGLHGRGEGPGVFGKWCDGVKGYLQDLGVPRVCQLLKWNGVGQ